MTGLLARAVRATASAADRDTVLERAADVLLDVADWVFADRLDDPDLITRVATVDRSGRLVDGAPHRPGASARPLQRRSGADRVGMLPTLLAAPRQLLRLSAAELREIAGGPESHAAAQARLALERGTVDLLVVAASSRDVPQGVLALGSRTGFGDDVVAQLLDVASHVGLALDAAALLRGRRAVATALQTSLLPPVPVLEGRQLAARYVPAAHELEVGGDWYDAFTTASGLTLVIGDVRGHDLTAAAQMADLRNLLRAHAVDRDEPPSALLRRLGRTTARLGLDISATCVVAVLEPDGVLTWSNAGHLPPLLLRQGRTRLLDTSPDLLLGVDADAGRADHVEHLQPGDTLVLFTDGLVEVRDRSLDERLDELCAVAAAAGSAAPDVLAERLLGMAAGSTDDVAVLAVHLPPD